jgi:DNA repair protein RecO (recombination protein O)
MRIEQQPGYVLHARPYRETSLLLECLTRDHGRLGVVARGTRGEKSRSKRAQLEPFQLVSFGLMLRGELATLTEVEAVGTTPRLAGPVALAGLYLNELVVRLTERQDPLPQIFDAYAQTLARLPSGDSMSWTLRRFERDLLQGLGYGLQLQYEAETGEPLDPAAYYRYAAEQGALSCASREADAMLGDHLLALGEDRMPALDGLKALRGLMREMIRFQLGGGELRSWRVLAQAMSRG